VKQWFSRLGFGKKVQILINVVSIGVLLLAISAIGVSFYGEFKRNLEDRVTQKSKLLADAAAVGVVFDQSESVKMLLASLAVDSEVQQAVVYRKLGPADYQYFAHYQREGLTTQPVEAYEGGPQQQWQKGRFVIRMPILVDGEEVGRLVLSENDNYLAIFSRNIINYLLPILLASIALVWLVSRSIQKRVAAPLKQLTSAVEKVAYKQDYSQQVSIKSNDEFGDLGRAFNTMLEKLHEHNEFRVEKELEIIKLNANLEDKVYERTKALKKSVDDLKQTQQQLVEQEKMASLGELVAGVAHEINTPIGVGITAVSHLEQSVHRLNTSFQNNELTKQQFTDMLLAINESTDILNGNLKRAADLVKAFKSVAVDQSSAEPRLFNLKNYLYDVLTSLRPKLKRVHHQIDVNVAEDIDLYCDPGMVSQIYTNLLLNSLHHAYQQGEKGHIIIAAQKTDGALLLTYSDDGAGIDPSVLPRLFDPFVTTKRGQGGSGLGTHIIYNLVTQGLGGQIQCISQLGEGTRFEMSIPLSRVTPAEIRY